MTSTDEQPADIADLRNRVQAERIVAERERAANDPLRQEIERLRGRLATETRLHGEATAELDRFRNAAAAAACVGCMYREDHRRRAFASLRQMGAQVVAAEEAWQHECDNVDRLRTERDEKAVALGRVLAECDGMDREVWGRHPLATKGLNEATARIRAAVAGPTQ